MAPEHTEHYRQENSVFHVAAFIHPKLSVQIPQLSVCHCTVTKQSVECLDTTSTGFVVLVPQPAVFSNILHHNQHCSAIYCTTSSIVQQYTAPRPALFSNTLHHVQYC